MPLKLYERRSSSVTSSITSGYMPLKLYERHSSSAQAALRADICRRRSCSSSTNSSTSSAQAALRAALKQLYERHYEQRSSSTSGYMPLKLYERHSSSAQTALRADICRRRSSSTSSAAQVLRADICRRFNKQLYAGRYERRRRHSNSTSVIMPLVLYIITNSVFFCLHACSVCLVSKRFKQCR